MYHRSTEKINRRFQHGIHVGRRYKANVLTHDRLNILQIRFIILWDNDRFDPGAIRRSAGHARAA